MVAYHKLKSLRDIQLRAEIKPNEVVNKGCHKCGSVKCKVCDYITKARSLLVRLKAGNMLLITN